MEKPGEETPGAVAPADKPAEGVVHQWCEWLKEEWMAVQSGKE